MDKCWKDALDLLYQTGLEEKLLLNFADHLYQLGILAATLCTLQHLRNHGFQLHAYPCQQVDLWIGTGRLEAR